MADPNQLKPGSLSRETPRATGTPVGSTHGDGDGSRAVAEATEMGTELIGAVREGATSFFEEQRNRAGQGGRAGRRARPAMISARSAGRYRAARMPAMAATVLADHVDGGRSRRAGRLRGPAEDRPVDHDAAVGSGQRDDPADPAGDGAVQG